MEQFADFLCFHDIKAKARHSSGVVHHVQIERIAAVMAIRLLYADCTIALPRKHERAKAYLAKYA
jgi:hypothetical protein